MMDFTLCLYAGHIKRGDLTSGASCFCCWGNGLRRELLAKTSEL